MTVIKRDTDYALRALVYLGLRPARLVSATDIASGEDIPLDYLQKIMQKFVKSGLVMSRRGAHGGFYLAKDPDQITLLDAVEAIQGKIAMNRCLLGKEGCTRAHQCRLKDKLLQIEKHIGGSLAGITLRDLLNEVAGE